jgi:hypothetical protein
VFSAAGALELALGRANYSGVAVHGSNVFAHNVDCERCDVFAP